MATQTSVSRDHRRRVHTFLISKRQILQKRYNFAGVV